MFQNFSASETTTKNEIISLKSGQCQIYYIKNLLRTVIYSIFSMFINVTEIPMEYFSRFNTFLSTIPGLLEILRDFENNLANTICSVIEIVYCLLLHTSMFKYLINISGYVSNLVSDFIPNLIPLLSNNLISNNLLSIISRII